MEEKMNYTKGALNIADYGLTIAEVTGHRQRSSLEKYGLTGVKLFLSATQDDNDAESLKEIGQAGISVLCDIGGYITGDRRTAAKMELFGKAIIDIAAMVMSDKRYPAT
jgi:hypothetical protein